MHLFLFAILRTHLSWSRSNDIVKIYRTFIYSIVMTFQTCGIWPHFNSVNPFRDDGYYSVQLIMSSGYRLHKRVNITLDIIVRWRKIQRKADLVRIEWGVNSMQDLSTCYTVLFFRDISQTSPPAICLASVFLFFNFCVQVIISFMTIREM